MGGGGRCVIRAENEHTCDAHMDTTLVSGNLTPLIHPPASCSCTDGTHHSLSPIMWCVGCMQEWNYVELGVKVENVENVEIVEIIELTAIPLAHIPFIWMH